MVGAGKGREIAEAALRLFAEKGVRATTTREVAELAGCAEGNIYRHFQGKEDLALHLLEENMDRFTSHLQAAVAQASPTPSARLAALIGSFFAFARSQPLAYAYIMNAHQTEFGRLARERFKPKDVFVQVVRQGMEAGAFRPVDPELAAAMVIGMAIRVNFFLERGLISWERERAVEEVAASACRLLEKEENG